jgi:hypothetical protein
LGASVLGFCLRSLFKEYGLAFIRKVVLPHPIRTFKGIKRYIKKYSGRHTSEIHRPRTELPKSWSGNDKIAVGLGFCLKPMEPECVSGRPNHDCFFFEQQLYLQGKKVPESCRECLIHKIGLEALKAGCSLYIMTSANDILFDLFLPSLEERTFSKALLGLCHYSFEPFKIGLCVSSLEAVLFPYESGDCKDYKSWRLADIGIKDEQTSLSGPDLESIYQILRLLQKEKGKKNRFKKKGNIFFNHV